jgi:predicted enzyme related to lactoylglutathione lyase
MPSVEHDFALLARDDTLNHRLMTNAHGHFAWHELGTSDLEAAKAFYPKITPWTTEPMDGMPDYTLWMNGGVPVGGVTRMPAELSSRGAGAQWIPYVHVYDVDEMVRQVKSLGGSVAVAPKEVPSVGCWAVLRDPHGAAIGIYEPADNTPSAYMPAKRGEFSWHELATTDYKAAFEFYRTLFHWEKTAEHDMGAWGVYFMFGQNGVPYGGMFNKPADAPDPLWISYVKIDDVSAAAPNVTAAGGTVIVAPHEVPGGDWIVRCADAQGATFALQSSKA